MGTIKPVLAAASHSTAEHTQTHISTKTHVHSGPTHNYTAISRQSDLTLQHTQTQAEKRSIQQEVMLQSTVTGTLTNIHTETGTQQVTVFGAKQGGSSVLRGLVAGFGVSQQSRNFVCVCVFF